MFARVISQEFENYNKKGPNLPPPPTGGGQPGGIVLTTRPYLRAVGRGGGFPSYYILSYYTGTYSEDVEECDIILDK